MIPHPILNPKPLHPTPYQPASAAGQPAGQPNSPLNPKHVGSVLDPRYLLLAAERLSSVGGYFKQTYFVLLILGTRGLLLTAARLSIFRANKKQNIGNAP